MKRKRLPYGYDAYIKFWAGRYSVLTYPDQKRVTSSYRARDAIRRARLKGYTVKLHGTMYESGKILKPLI